jgi:hypothetical protein
MNDGRLEARREYAANAILEDVRLRGELSDEEYGPIQAEALAYVDAKARATAGLDDEAARRAIEASIAEAKDRVRSRTAKPAAPAVLPISQPANPFAGFLRRLRLRL